MSDSEHKVFSVIIKDGTADHKAMRLRRATWTEHISRPFEGHLELLSEKDDLDLEPLLGASVTVEMDLEEDKFRYFNGLVSRFSYAGPEGRSHVYHATLRPWIWFLANTADCRMFQGETVPDIALKVFRDNGFGDFESRVESGDYRKWNYCIQYRETDLNFVSRLLEQEGIRYYFKHEKEKHTLVIADPSSTMDKGIAGLEVVEYSAHGSDAATAGRIHRWEVSHQATPRFYEHNDYDYENPRSDLTTYGFGPERAHAHGEREVFDYPGEYVTTDEGAAYATVRMEGLYCQYEIANGHGDFPGVAAGHGLKLENNARAGEFLVISAHHEMYVGDRESGRGPGTKGYSVQLCAVEHTTPYRPSRITPKPVIQGPQTATVVGPKDEAAGEVCTDKYGRVLVRFPWDRREADHSHDESDKGRDLDAEKKQLWSCWIRVAQGWAGPGWGHMHIPHVGHEVLVDFLEGDPDRPIITGSVYNDKNMPPLELPSHKTKNIFRDIYGNQLIFHSGPENQYIYMYCPTNKTYLRFGDLGLQLKTDGDHDETTHGRTTKCHFGVDASWWVGAKIAGIGGADTKFIVGTKFEFVGGVSIKAHLGVQASYSGGGRFEYARGFRLDDVSGPKFSTSTGPSITRSDDKIVLDSKLDTIIAGGASDQAKIIANDTMVQLGFGSDNVKQKHDDDEARRKAHSATLAAMGGAIGASVAATAAGVMVHKKKQDAGQCGEEGHGVDVPNAALIALIGAGSVAALAGGGAYMVKAKKLNADAKAAKREYTDTQKERFAEITLNKDGIELKGLAGDMAADPPPTLIKLNKSGALEISAQAGLKITVTGPINMTATEKITIKSDAEVHIDAPVFNHPDQENK